MKISIEYELPHDDFDYKLYINAPINYNKLNKIYNFIGLKISKGKLTKEEIKTLQDILDIIKEGNDK